MERKKILVRGIIIILIIAVAGIIIQNFTAKEEVVYQTAPPAEVVRQYFESWDAEDWPNMYATLSDGFKKIDPQAKDLASFRLFASSQGIAVVKIVSIREESNDGKTASVKYSAEFILSDGSTTPFSDSFSLKFREVDIIPGWKLIHPYGENIDTT